MLDLNINLAQPSESFQRIANDLMNNWHLVSGNKKYRITEIEFYYKHKKYHKDPYVHGHKQQKTSHQWYFHGSGIDLTFGTDEFYGGILIRAIYNDEDSEYHYGPLKILTELFKNFDGIYNYDTSWGLEPITFWHFDKEKPIAAPRVGLNPTKDPDMAKRLYRFIVMRKFEHKEKGKILQSMIEQGYSEEEANEIWG